MTTHSSLNSFLDSPKRVSHMPLAHYIYPFLSLHFPSLLTRPKITKIPFLIFSAIQNLQQIKKEKNSIQKKSHQFFCCIWLIHREIITPVHSTSRAGCSGADRLLSKSVRRHPGTWRFRFYPRWPPRRRRRTIKI